MELVLSKFVVVEFPNGREIHILLLLVIEGTCPIEHRKLLALFGLLFSVEKLRPFRNYIFLLFFFHIYQIATVIFFMKNYEKCNSNTFFIFGHAIF